MPQIQRFTIKQLLVVTTVSGLLLATAQWLGLEASALIIMLLYAFAPLIAFLAACSLQDASLQSRISVGAVVTGVLILLAIGLLFAAGEPRIVAPMFVGTSCFWASQWAGIALLFQVWKSGIRSAEAAESRLLDLQRERAAQEEAGTRP